MRCVAFHGHIISSEGVEVEPRKTIGVKNWPRTFDLTDNRNFIGLAEYYRRFIDGFASIAFSLTILTQKNVKFELSQNCEKSFKLLEG